MDYRLPSLSRNTTLVALSSAVHLNRFLARRVLEAVHGTDLRAVCPPSGLDRSHLESVIAHASVSERRWTTLDRVILGIQTLTLGELVVAAGAIFWWDASPVIFVLLILASLGLGVVASTLAFVGARTQFLRVTRYLEDATKKTLPPLPPINFAGAGRTFADIDECNMIVFSTTLSRPFVGSGIQVARWLTPPIDVTVPAGSDPPTSFTAWELYESLRQKMASRKDIRVRERLYIRGDVIALSDVWEDRERPPPLRVARRWLHSGVVSPVEHARTYLCFEYWLEQGLVILTMFARVALRDGRLTIELVVYVLPPIAQVEFTMPRYLINIYDTDLQPAGGRSDTRALLAAGLRLFLRQVRSPRLPGPPAGSTGSNLKERRIKKQQKAALENRYAYDFGAKTSLREALSLPGVNSYFHLIDLQDAISRMQQLVVDHIQSFLESKNVDTSDFRKRREQLITQQIYNFGNVNGTGNVFGANGQVHNTGVRSTADTTDQHEGSTS